MRTASMVLGLVGGCIALILAILFVVGGLMLTSILPDVFDSDLFDELEAYEEFEDAVDMDLAEETMDFAFNIGGSFLWIYAALLVISAVAGIVGGIIVKKKNVAAGVVMLVGGVLTLITIWGILSGLLLIAAGILALVKDKNAGEPAAPVQV